MNKKIFLSSIIGGVIITILTGLLLYTPHMLVGATHYGYPLPWLIRLVLAPQYFPWRVNIAYLIADIIVWSVIVGIIIFVVKRVKK